ncbi:Piso0_004991 [Millerozyma farinosa CBS 7064]|uniref:Piso0_004991 protein n=1 Tax=Pichia sorbitophila (strain ATCC MYA-4447 / BCRC 22081 / CBS 7064 / NBRC 10061 / NRRL Y-12695) TaxID=559304 RepID=G8Y3X7_PICSO|nr:Piso0_004991 [Millerozyma farinosa CBS 7064]
MSTSGDTNRLISQSLNLVSRIIENDTEATTIDLNLLENLNTNQSLNYIKLERNLTDIEKNCSSFENLGAEFKRHMSKVDEIQEKVSKLENLVIELDKWSQEAYAESSRT